MYKVFLTNEPEGFPIELDGFLKFVQDGYTAPLEAFARAFGNMVIIDGMVETAGAVTDGFANINNELVFFVGGSIPVVHPAFDVTDETANLIYKGGVPKPVLKTRVARFNTSGTGTYSYTMLERIQKSPNNGFAQRLGRIEAMLKPLLPYTDGTGATVYGSWLFWGRPANEIPTGWEAVPDGDLKGRVLVGKNIDGQLFGTIGEIGGNAEHTLTINEMPEHDHVMHGQGAISENGGGQGYLSRLSNAYSGGGSDGFGAANAPDSGMKTGFSGNGNPFSIVQPYRVVLYIRFIG